MQFAVISCSLKSESRSRLMARAALDDLRELGETPDWIDLRDHPLPLCDGGAAYGRPEVKEMKARLLPVDGFLIASPIYNYDVNSALKNLVELTGNDVWGGKVAAFLCAAGSPASYMSVMALANSLMLDFRTVIVPRFVYATGQAFDPKGISDAEIRQRVAGCAESLRAMTRRLRDADGAQ